MEDPTSYRFGAFELDVARKELRHEGAVVAIARKPLELLILLVRHCDRVVSRQEALSAVWSGVRVSDATVSSTLRDLRRALADEAEAPAFVETARGLGFRFIAPVEARSARVAGSDRAGAASYVGRQALRDRLEDALAAASGGRGRVVVLEGEPGIGKTRALEMLASSARTTGAIVCQARFPETGGGPPYRPWAQLLEVLVATRPPGRLAEEIGSGLPWLARLVPGLTVLPGSDGVGGDEGDEGAMLRLFDAVTAFLRRVSRSAPLVLLLDDLHGADRSSLHLLESLADEIREERILIVGAYRSCELDSEHPFPATLAELARLPSYVRIRLEGVDLAATAALVAAATGREPGAAQLAEIHARTDGNPFYVHELASYLAAAGAETGPRSVPPNLRDLLRGRLQRLPLRCRDTLELASVIGREFEVELLRRASGLDAGDLLDALEVGRRAGLVEIGWGGTRRFRHILVQEAIYAALPEARRRQLHRRVGEACRTWASADHPDRLATVADHLCRVAEDVGVDAFDAALAAAEHAEAGLAFEEAERLYQLALDTLDRLDPGDRVRRCPVKLALARSQLGAGELGKAVATARRSAALARAIGRPDLLAEAALLFAEYVLIDSSEPYALLQEALASLGPEHEALRGRSLAALATTLWYEGQTERRIALADEALAIARAAERPADLVSALIAKRHALVGPQHLQGRLRLADQALREAERQNLDAQLCLLLSWRAADLMQAGDRVASEDDVTRMDEVARAAKLRRFLDHPCRWRALFAMTEGRFDDAEKWIAESALWRQRADVQNAESYALIQGGLLMRERGNHAQIEAVVRNAPWLAPYRARVPTVRVASALIELEGGHPGAARRVLAEFAADDCAALAADPEQLGTASWLAEICARLGARDAARALHAYLAPWRDQFAGTYAIVCRGSMARYVGLLAATAGRADEAAECFEAAVAANRTVGASLYVAWSQWDHACLLAAEGDRERAAALAAEARAEADRLGLGKLRKQIETVGLPPPAR